MFFKNLKVFENILIWVLLVVFIIILTFGRDGQDFQIFQFKVGEIFIALAFLISFYILFMKEVDNIFKIFIIINFLSLIFYFTYPISFRLSSYVWSMSIYFFLVNKINVTKKILNLTFILLFFQNFIFLSSYLLPGFKLQRYFNSTEQVVVSIFFLFIILNSSLNVKFKILCLIILSPTLILLINFSRASGIAIISCLVIISLLMKKSEVNFLIATLLLFTFIFGFLFNKLDIAKDLNQYDYLLQANLEQSINNLNSDEFLDTTFGDSLNKDFFGSENFYSSQLYFHTSKSANALSCNSSLIRIPIKLNDPNLTWRVEIIEDVLNCSTLTTSTFLIGRGYERIMIPLDNIYRNGGNPSRPTTSPHNIFLYVFYHGGLISLLIFIYMLFKISKLDGTKIPSPTLIGFIISGLFGVVFETVNQLIFWAFLILEKEMVKKIHQ